MADKTIANLEIVYAVSWKWGNVTRSALHAYVLHIQAEEVGGIRDNSWTPKLPGLPGGGAIFWKVQYPIAPGSPKTDYGFSSVQTTLINDLEGNTTQSINYDPSLLQTSPFKAFPNSDMRVCAARWGDQDFTGEIQNVMAGGNPLTTATMQMKDYCTPPADPSSRVCIVYAYTSSSYQSIDVQFGGYDAPGSDDVTLYRSPPPKLTILGALLGKTDVTAGLQALVSGQQSLFARLDTIRTRFPGREGDSLPVTVLSVLYQHEGQEMRCWARKIGEGNLSITAGDPPPGINLVRNARAGESNLLAVVWGDGSSTAQNKTWPLAEQVNDSITIAPSFVASVKFLGPKPNSSFRSSCHVYYSYGVTGIVRSLAAFEDETATLQPRDWSFLDPKPAQGFLNPQGAPDQTEFKLKVLLDGKYVGVEKYGANAFRLRIVSDNDAAIFSFVPINTENSNEIRMLKVREKSDKNKWYYLGSNTAWNPRAINPAICLPREAIGSAYQNAFSANYELAVGSADDGLMFCATKTTGPKDTYQPGVLALVLEHGFISLVPLSQALMSPTFMFVPEFLKVALTTPSISKDISPCQASIYDLVYHVAEGALQLILPRLGLKTNERVLRVKSWLDKQTKPAQATILGLIREMQMFFQSSVGAANGAGSASRMSTLIGYVWRFIKQVWAYKGALWALIKHLLLGVTADYWTICRYGFQVVGFALKYTNAATALAYSIVQWGIWCTDLGGYATNAVRDCVASMVADSPNALLRARYLNVALAKVRESKELRALPEQEQFDVLQALSSPAVAHVLNDTNDAEVPQVHPLVDWHDTILAGEGLQQRHLEDSHAGLYNAVSPSALQIARLYAPEIQDSLRG